MKTIDSIPTSKIQRASKLIQTQHFNWLMI